MQAEKAAQAAARRRRADGRGRPKGRAGGWRRRRRQAADAQRSLADARRQLADQLGQAAARLTAEQVARLEDNVKHLRRQQENALDEAQRLRGLEESQGQLTRSQALSLHELARLQRSLQTDAARLGQQLSGAGAFELALIGAAGDMGQAADSLDRRQTGPPTQDAQRRAIRRLDLLVDALKPEPPAEPQDNSSSGGNNGGTKGPQGAGLPSLAELKLLKLMQQEINFRIESLNRPVCRRQTDPRAIAPVFRLSSNRATWPTSCCDPLQPAEQNADAATDAAARGQANL